jgi:hypothetical protein
LHLSLWHHGSEEILGMLTSISEVFTNPCALSSNDTFFLKIAAKIRVISLKSGFNVSLRLLVAFLGQNIDQVFKKL